MREQYDVSMCIDCAMFHANGELPSDANDERRFEIVHPKELRDENGEDYSTKVFVTGEENYFSWYQCDLCHCGLGGDRIDGIVVLV